MLKKFLDTTKHADLVDHQLCMKLCMQGKRPEGGRGRGKGRGKGRKACFDELDCRPARTATRDQVKAAVEKCKPEKEEREEKQAQRTGRMLKKCECAVDAGIDLKDE